MTTLERAKNYLSPFDCLSPKGFVVQNVTCLTASRRSRRSKQSTLLFTGSHLVFLALPSGKILYKIQTIYFSYIPSLFPSLYQTQLNNVNDF